MCSSPSSMQILKISHSEVPEVRLFLLELFSKLTYHSPCFDFLLKSRNKVFWVWERRKSFRKGVEGRRGGGVIQINLRWSGVRVVPLNLLLPKQKWQQISKRRQFINKNIIYTVICILVPYNRFISKNIGRAHTKLTSLVSSKKPQAKSTMFLQDPMRVPLSEWCRCCRNAAMLSNSRGISNLKLVSQSSSQEQQLGLLNAILRFYASSYRSRYRKYIVPKNILVFFFFKLKRSNGKLIDQSSRIHCLRFRYMTWLLS